MILAVCVIVVATIFAVYALHFLYDYSREHNRNFYRTQASIWVLVALLAASFPFPGWYTFTFGLAAAGLLHDQFFQPKNP